MEQLDVLFVNPNASRKNYQALSRDLSAIEPPVWAALLANHTRRNGLETAILDCEAERIDPLASAKRIKEFNSRLTVIVVYGQHPAASTQNMEGVHHLCETMKDYYPEYKIILVGIYPSALSRKTMEDEKIDFVCQGEGPLTITALSQVDMNDVSQLKKVPGLWFRDRGNIQCTSPASIIPRENLHEILPGMAWDLLSIEKYRTANWHAMTNNNERTPFASLYTSLGCPYSCSFCCTNAPFGSNNLDNSNGVTSFRYWDPNFIIGEFDKIYEMGVRNIKIADEMFIFNVNHFMEVCELIIERGYDFNIWCYGRIDTIKVEYLETLKKAGVNWLAVGVESASSYVRQDVVKGNFSKTNIIELVQSVKDTGINIIGNYIFGLPEDNYETMRDTLGLAIELNCEFVNFYTAMAYPGSALYIEALKNKWPLPETYSGFSQHSFDTLPLPTKYISSSDVLRFRDEAFHTYYTNSNYLAMIDSKFGQDAVQMINEMISHKLDRKTLIED
tara:strand:- start:77 stop:1585 length:1509 start_codon:yes stop_codon:yes gene_type:complete